MREIKFRAWLLELKKMVIPTAIRFVEKGVAIEYEYKGQRCLDGPGYFDLMQFTGMLDKNGVKIFEGDIVSEKTKSYEHSGIVMWNQETASFAIKWNGTGNIAGLATFNYCSEIIGNIHEHPELLKEQK